MIEHKLVNGREIIRAFREYLLQISCVILILGRGNFNRINLIMDAFRFKEIAFLISRTESGLYNRIRNLRDLPGYI